MLNFTSKYIYSIKWSSFGHIFYLLVKLLVFFYISKEFPTDEIASLGICISLISLFNLPVQAGAQMEIISGFKSNNQIHNGVFTLLVLYSVAPLLLLLGFSSSVADFFNIKSSYYVQITAILVILKLQEIVPRSLLDFQLNFKINGQVLAGAALVFIFSVLVLRNSYNNILLILYSEIASSLFVIIASYTTLHIYPKFQHNSKLILNKNGFVFNSAISNTIGYANNQFIVLLLAKFFPHAAVGQFYLGKRFSDFFVNAIDGTIHRSIFPLFSNIKGDSAKFNRALMTFTYFRALLLTPPVLMIVLFSSEIVHFFYEDKYDYLDQIISLVFLVPLFRFMLPPSIKILQIHKAHAYINLIYFIQLVLTISAALMVINLKSSMLPLVEYIVTLQVFIFFILAFFSIKKTQIPILFFLSRMKRIYIGIGFITLYSHIAQDILSISTNEGIVKIIINLAPFLLLYIFTLSDIRKVLYTLFYKR